MMTLLIPLLIILIVLFFSRFNMNTSLVLWSPINLLILFASTYLLVYGLEILSTMALVSFVVIPVALIAIVVAIVDIYCLTPEKS